MIFCENCYKQLKEKTGNIDEVTAMEMLKESRDLVFNELIKRGWKPLNSREHYLLKGIIEVLINDYS